MPIQPGMHLGPYEILERVGAGGMGEVYRARHVKLRRDVAIKVLPNELAADAAGLQRFEREARTASALNHPNIVTIHDIAEQDGITYIAMELVEGRTLRELGAQVAEAGESLPIDRALVIATQVADALAKAHEAGIIHRDIKPANIMVTAGGLVKVLDFGLAKPIRARDGQVLASTATRPTLEGELVGTPHYMAPEQLAGDPVDHRADQFAFGVTLYEMLGGRPPFDGESLPAVISAILTDTPEPLRHLRPDVPTDIERVVTRCLAKESAARYGQTGELAAELRRCADRRAARARGIRAALRRPAVVGSLVVVVLGLGAGAWTWMSGLGARWADRYALAEIERLSDAGDVYAAYRTARRAMRYRPDDPALQRIIDRITIPLTINTQPAGAEVWVKGYATPEARWELMGVTPLPMRVPYALMRWMIRRDGFEPFVGAPFSGPALGALGVGLQLDTAGSLTPGMVRIPGGPLPTLSGARPTGQLPQLPVPSFELDRYEVTNREYRAFIDAGGYDDRALWPATFVRDGDSLTWDEARDALRDATGRYGPSTWEVGRYPDGEAEHPVAGVSWFEALAFCEHAGKTLPSVYHWFRALGQDQLSDILRHSNMDGNGTAEVGAFRGLAAYGTYDMAGNVKEWVWNRVGDSRYILGGAWNEPTYVFKHLVAQDPWNRGATNGIRCARYPEPPAGELLAALTPQPEYERPAPLSDATFEALRGLYAYAPRPLDARVERVNDSLPGYRRETVSIATAYDERMEVHLLIPRDVPPPWQSVIWYPGDDVYLFRSSEDFSSKYLFDFIPRDGRVLVYPVYDDMYERFEARQRGPFWRRDHMIHASQDIARTIDYLETRPDFDASKVAYYGFSAGAIYGPVFTAVEPRIAAAIYLGGGFIPVPWRPEVNPAHFAPHSLTPTLMINGRDDFLMPYELAQRPLLEMLGAPADRKRHARLEGGHIPNERRDIIREVLAWLDLQLGPVKPAN